MCIPSCPCMADVLVLDVPQHTRTWLLSPVAVCIAQYIDDTGSRSVDPAYVLLLVK